MKADKKIAYQTVDSEGDIWSNQAFLFDDDEQAEEFFSNPSQVLKTLSIELEEGEELEDIDYHSTRQEVKFSCQYSGDVRILKMDEGFLIKK